MSRVIVSCTVGGLSLTQGDEHGERSLAADAAGVGPDYEGCRGDDGADSDELEEVGSPLLDEVLDALLVAFCLGAEGTDPAGEGSHGLATPVIEVPPAGRQWMHVSTT